MKTDRLLHASLGVMLCLFVFALYSSLHDHLVKVGDTAPNFSIRTDSGKVITPRDFGGKVLILNFWASWCAPCVYEAPSLEKLAAEYGPKGLVVLGISQDQKEEDYKGFIDHFNVTFQTAREPDKTTQYRYGTLQIPESYIIDSHGKVVEKVVSEVDWTSDAMKQYIESLL